MVHLLVRCDIKSDLIGLSWKYSTPTNPAVRGKVIKLLLERAGHSQGPGIEENGLFKSFSMLDAVVAPWLHLKNKAINETAVKISPFPPPPHDVTLTYAWCTQFLWSGSLF